MILRDFFTEAANPAQQAAIAIAMKKAHKKPKSLKEFARTDDEGREFMSWPEFLAIVTPAMRKWGFRSDYKNPQIMYSRQGRGRGEYYIIVLDPQEDMVQYSFMTMDSGQPEMHENNFVGMDRNGAYSLLAKIDEGYSLSDLKQGVAEACWPGYHKDGMKTMFGKRYPNCIKNKKKNEDTIQEFVEETLGQKNSDEIRRIQQMLNKKFGANLDVDGVLGPLTKQSIQKFLPGADTAPAPKPERTTAVQGLKKKSVAEQQCPECGGPMFSELMINEKQDACYYKVKSRYKVWPSAYASGALVQCRKKGAANWGNKSRK